MSTHCQPEARDFAAEIAELKSRDCLTGLYNRVHFIRLTRAELKKQRPGVVKALFYIRPDRFSSIDQRFGPMGSDTLLQALGEVIGENVGKHSVAARFGGNIFTVLVLRRSFSEIRQLAQDLVAKISASVFVAGQLSTSMTVSLGLVELSESIDDATHAFSLAQSAARRARDRGGDQLHVDQSLEVDEHGNLQDAGWVRKIRTALEDDAFHLVYQPIASLRGAASYSSDVLVRMLDDSGEDILPGEFMPAAARTGLMPAIDRWVIKQAFRVAAERTAEGKRSTFFLRVSESSLQDTSFTGWLIERTLHHEPKPGSIVLQVSESIAELNISQIRGLAAVCKDLHFQLAMANVGVVENSLQLMKLIPMDYIVIDGGFMENLDDEDARERLEQIVSAAVEKGVATIGSRVENAAELAVLCHMGMDYVVGYHVQEPEETIIEDVTLPG